MFIASNNFWEKNFHFTVNQIFQLFIQVTLHHTPPPLYLEQAPPLFSFPTHTADTRKEFRRKLIRAAIEWQKRQDLGMTLYV